MDAIRDFFKNTFGQSSSFWKDLSTPKRIGIIGAILAVIAVLLSVVLLQDNKQYQYLFVNLASEDTHAIAAALKKTGFSDFIIDDKGVKVPEDQVVQYRMLLAQEGLPSHGQVGWEKFDDPDFSRTEFERNIHKVRAMQGELSRTITSIDGITSARVHIVNPKKRLFEQDQKEPTAAIYVRTKRSMSLSDKQIKGILHLVSKSVEGLKPENISIIDFSGKLLTEERSKDPTARETKEVLEFKMNIERRLEEKVRAIVGRVVGQDRVEAKVDVDLDFTKEEQTISDVDPDRSVVLSQNTVNQATEGTGLNPTGIPGSKSNVPGEQEALNLQTSKAMNKRDSELINYEIAKKISHKVLPFAKLKRISAAVIVDGGQAYPLDGSQPVFEPRTPEEMQKIEELVKSAIGFKDGRDEVKVHNLLFQLDYIQVEAQKVERKEQREYLVTLFISGAIALGLVLFFAFIVRPYFQWLSYDPQRKEKEKIIEEFRPDLELSGIQNVQVKEDVPFDKLSPQEQVVYVAKHEPVRTTEALRMLLNPHSSAG